MKFNEKYRVLRQEMGKTSCSKKLKGKYETSRKLTYKGCLESCDVRRQKHELQLKWLSSSCNIYLLFAMPHVFTQKISTMLRTP